MYGSSGSARTFELILKQSPLIELFRRVHGVIQDNFHLLHRSVRHAPPDIRKTLDVLCELLEKYKAHEFKPGRTACKLKDHFRDGMVILQTEKGTTSQVDEDNDTSIEIQAEDLDAE